MGRGSVSDEFHIFYLHNTIKLCRFKYYKNTGTLLIIVAINQ